MKNYFELVLNKLENYKHLGRETLKDGTILIARAPHIAPYAWLHNVFPTLDQKELNGLKDKLGFDIPSDYEIFLTKHSNGLHIFLDVLQLDGLRRRQGRSIEDAYQPFSILTPNVEERLVDAEDDMFFIGSYSWDGSLLYFKGSKVYRSSVESAAPLNVWNSFEEMLLSETDRIIQLFDKNGMQINEDIPTVPVRQKF